MKQELQWKGKAISRLKKAELCEIILFQEMAIRKFSDRVINPPKFKKLIGRLFWKTS